MGCLMAFSVQAQTDSTAKSTAAEIIQPQDDVRVMRDPDGHPFCLYT